MNPGGQSEQFIAEAMRSSKRERRLVSWYVTRRLSDPFIGTMLGGTQSLMIDDSRKTQHEGVLTATEFFRHLAKVPASGVVTTNYDLLVEYALGTMGFNYGLPNQTLAGRGKNPWFPWQNTPVTLRGILRFAKIHGSVSWDGTRYFTDGRCGVRGDALIIAPGPDKLPPAELRSSWELARSILESSEQLLVFGFAFNPYDEAVLHLLAAAGTNLKSALLVDPDPKLDLAAAVWPNAAIRAVSPPASREDELLDWTARALREIGSG